MKILLVSPTPTHPCTAGNRARIAAMARHMMKDGHEVQLAFVPMEAGDVEQMRAAFPAGFHLLPYQAPAARTGRVHRMRRRMQRLLGLAGAHVWRVDDWFDPRISVAVRELQAREAFDVICVEYVFLSALLESLPDSVLKVIDTHDRFADRHLEYLRSGRRPEWFATTRSEERRGLERAHVVLAIQEQEGRHFDALLSGRRRVVTVGHFVDDQPGSQADAPAAALFLASANSINVEGARYFIDQVLPLVRARRPDFVLVLAGDICAAVPAHPGVRLLGRVAMLQEAYRQASLAVNPVRMGTGLNIKSMDSLAAGMPFVTTECGSRGLEELRGTAFICVPDDDPQRMCVEIVGLLEDPARRRSLGLAARVAAEAWNQRQRRNLALAFERVA